MDVTRRAFLATGGIAVLTLAGCNQQAESDADEAQGSEPTPKPDEPETQTANVGDAVTYESSRGGEFRFTIDGIVTDQVTTENLMEYGMLTDGYCIDLLLMTVENVSVATNPDEYQSFSGVWLEDADGITLNPTGNGQDYGEYKVAGDFIVQISEGQTIRVAVPYQVAIDNTEFTVVIGDTEVQVALG